MDKVSLHSKSNTSLTLDPSSYPKDLDPFGDEDGDEMSNSGDSKDQTLKSSALVEPSYPGTLDPFADNDGDKKNISVNSNSQRSNKRVSAISNHAKSPNNNGVSLETSITRSDYDESLDPFGEESNTGENDCQSIDSSRESRKPAIITANTSENASTNVNDSFSTKSETESASSGEMIKRGVDERNSYSNQNSPVPVPPRRKHRNVSPSTKSLNRASYSASSLEREPKNGISSPNSPTPNRLSTAETDSYLSHSISNLSTRSTSPVNTVRSSPIRSRKKRRAPEPPGFPPSAPPASSPSPSTPDTSFATDRDTSINNTAESITAMDDSINQPKSNPENEVHHETTRQPSPEPVCQANPESNNELNSELNHETSAIDEVENVSIAISEHISPENISKPDTEPTTENVSIIVSESETVTDHEHEHVDEHVLEPANDNISSEPNNDKSEETVSQSPVIAANDSTTPELTVNPDQLNRQQDLTVTDQ